MQGSRRMMYPFARNVHSLLFDPIDESTAMKIGEILLEALEK
jgi:phage baseplate assembly protein W